VLIIVRHGQTEVNARGLLLGRSDPPLDDQGRAQALAVAEVLSPARIVSSPLQRARQTAAIIGDKRGIDVEIDERWIELDYGTLEGQPISAVPAETWAQWRSDLSFVPGGGESLQTLASRVCAACEDLITEAGDHDIVVVSHVSPVKAAAAWALGVSQEATWRMYVAPGSITRIAPRPQGCVLASFNETPSPSKLR
jgi:broad specificity phosphatase PhoE